ncbi:MAG TPA: hypothetical protein VFQ53_33170 [Kofleriaceae bacterium]|nr:hypothetical protein [Kofleriaceae bacterium]
MAYPDPRVLVCVLGHELAPLIAAARSFRSDIELAVDEEYSSDEADDRMTDSFGVCWDTVTPGAYSDADEEAVEDHGAVMYVISPPLAQPVTLDGSIAAVLLVDHLIEHGATAAKIESSGVAHGIARWRALAAEIRRLHGGRDRVALARTVRAAVTKRPLGGDKFYESLGHHLIGIPEVYVPLANASDRESVRIMDSIADELVADGTDPVVRRHAARLDPKSPYEGGFAFKINPYGIVKLPVRPPAITPSRAGL